MSHDELETWLAGIRPDSPLATARDAIPDDGLPVDEAEVERIAARVADRMAPRRRSRIPWIVAAAAVAAGALWLMRPVDPAPTWPVDPADPALDRVRASARTGESQAVAWVEAGRIEDAVLLYRLLLAEQPTGPDAARWQLGLVDALRAQSDEAGAWQATIDLLDRYGPGSAWAARHPDSAVQDDVAAALRKAAVLAHQQGRQTGDAEALSRAGVAYELYLVDLARPEGEPQMRYAYGELLWAQERFDEAWEQYRTVAREHPESEHAKFCATSAVQAAQQLLRASDDPGPWRERLIDSADAFVALAPDDPTALPMRYQAAYAVYETDPGAAVTRFEEIVALAPDSAEAVYAANLVVDALVMEGDHAGAASRIAEWLEAGLGGPEDREELAEIGGKAAYEATRRAIREGADPDEAWAAYREQWPDGPEP